MPVTSPRRAPTLTIGDEKPGRTPLSSSIWMRSGLKSPPDVLVSPKSDAWDLAGGRRAVARIGGVGDHREDLAEAVGGAGGLGVHHLHQHAFEALEELRSGDQ